jgi:hypothetical protein
MNCRVCWTAIFLGAMLLSSRFSAPAQAQVAIGPGFVVAPCVRVEWDCRHVHVCAPFVNLNVNFCGCRGCLPACCTSETYSRSANGLYSPVTRQKLMQTAVELDQALGRFETADSWRHYLGLKPDDVLSTDSARQTELRNVSVSKNDEADKLIAILHRFDTANRDEKNRVITSLPEFQQVHTLLANYMAELPNESTATTDSTVFAGSSAIGVAQVTGVGLATDSARMLTTYPAENVREPVSNAMTSIPATGKLPEPVAKQGI